MGGCGVRGIGIIYFADVPDVFLGSSFIPPSLSPHQPDVTASMGVRRSTHGNQQFSAAVLCFSPCGWWVGDELGPGVGSV